MSDKHVKQIDELAKLISEYSLTQASFETDDFKISLKKSVPQMIAMPTGQVTSSASIDASHEEEAPVQVSAPVQQGTPISSPMMGIFYSSSSPSSPAFAKEGDTVVAGQVVGLIEAMKVFNEIHSTVSGVVKKVVAESGQLIHPGDPLLYIG